MNKKKKNDSLYFFWSASIVVCLALVIFSLIFVSCRTEPAEPEGEGSRPAISTTAPPSGDGDHQGAESENLPETAPPETAPPAPPPTALEGTEDMGQEYIDKFVFFGDSTTYGLAAYDIVSGSQVWTPRNGTYSLFLQSVNKIVYPETDEEVPIEDAVATKKPEYLLITLGVNGVAQMDRDYFISEYTDLVTRIQQHSPDTRIILNSIYPVARSYEYQEQINNEKIRAANDWVLAVAESTGVRYLDCAHVLEDSEGYLPEEYQNGDGMHLMPDALRMVIDYIRTHGYE